MDGLPIPSKEEKEQYLNQEQSIAIPVPTKEEYNKYVGSEAQPLFQDDGSLSDIRDLLASVAQGATFNLGDETLAAIQSVLESGDLSKYRELQQKYQSEYEKIKKRSENLSTAGEIIGSFAVPGMSVAGALAKGASVGGKLLSAMVPSAIASAASSIGASKKYIDPNKPLESIYELGKEGAVGGAYGAGAGLALGLLGKAAGKIGEKIEETKLKKPWYKVPETAEDLYLKEQMAIRDEAGKVLRMEPLDITTQPGSVAVVDMVKNTTKKATDELLKPVELARKEYGKILEPLKQIKITPIDPDSKALSSQFENISNFFKQNKDVLQKIDSDLYKKFTLPNNSTVFNSIKKEIPNYNEDAFNIAKDLFNLKYDPSYAQTLSKDYLNELLSINKTKEGKLVYDVFKKHYLNNFSSGGKLEDLYNLKKDLLQNSQLYKDKFSPNEYRKLYGSNWNPETKEKGVKGLVDNLHDIINDIDPKLQIANQKIKDAAKIPESIINRNLSADAQPVKLYDLDDAVAKNKLENILGSKIEIADAGNIQANKEKAFLLNILDDYSKMYSENSNIREQLTKPEDLAKEIFQTSRRSAANLSLNPIERGAYNLSPKDFMQKGLQTVPFSEMRIAKAQMQKAGKEFIEETPVLKAPVEAAKAVGKGLTFPARSAADALKKSTDPKMQKLGEYLEESLQNKKGAATAAALNTIFQNSKSRQELGLKPGESISEIEDK